MGRFDKLPGIDGENTTRRNVLVGSGYTLGGLMILGAATGDPEDEVDGNGNGNENGDEEADTDGDGETGDDGADSDKDGSSDGNGEENGDDESDGDGDDESEDEESEPDADQPETQSFSGSGQTVEQDISIQGGLTVIDATHQGESNFQVSLEDDSEFGESFVNEIGDYEGQTAELVEEGEYLLDVNADGDWEIDIDQPRANSGDSLPQSLSDSVNRVYGPIEFTGTHVATGEHSGEGNFIVRALPQEGQFGELIFNEVGNFEGETSFNFGEVGWLAVEADGEFSVEIE
ncbi:hypothetical protein [Natronosalvus caseinilyticus]|uniref:hypothetical protein n=1 Tax=Natronosalvus caseinilyticus TaxID=2953747 RepID=UPI0028AB0B74|nr:hypothetical protein [Natronosalvus caseinilyticus]